MLDMSIKEKTFTFWVIFILLTLILMIYLRPILLPFVAGAAIAYLLDPIVTMLKRAGLPRAVGALTILVIFAILILLLLVTVAPFLVRELKDFAVGLPAHMENLRGLIGGYYKDWFGTELTEIELGFEEALRRFADSSSLKLGSFLRHLWDGSLALVNMIALFVVTPVVAFYLLMDWPKLIAKMDSWVPRKHVETVRGLANQIDRTLNGFMRGQVTVCLLLAAFYAIGLVTIGLKHGFLIGVTAGLLSFIPYVGSMVGLFLAGGMALSQYWPELLPIGMVLGVFGAGQLIEGNVLQPKIVGDQVNLHPVWLIFALFVFGYLMGFVGMLVAVPLAATIGVLVRFALGQYLKSDIYKK